MAEDSDEKELNLDEGSDEASDPPPKSKAKLIGIVTVVALAIAGGAAYFLLGGSETADEDLEEMEAEVPVAEAFYLKLEPVFVINLPDRGKQRFLQASVTLMGRNSASLQKIEQHMPVFRHSLTNVLSAQTISSIQTPGGIEQVRSQALAEINTLLTTDYGSEAVEQVLFTSFVMQ